MKSNRATNTISGPAIRSSCMALAFVALCVGPASAYRVSFFPLFTYEKRVRDGNSKSRFEAMGPLFATETTDDSYFISLRPFFNYETGGRYVRALDILFPFFHTDTRYHERHKETTKQTWLFPIYFYLERVEEDGERKKLRTLFPIYYSLEKEGEDGYKIVFPFFWWAKKTNVYFPIIWHHEENKFWAFWPIYGRFEKLFGRDEIKFFLWPFWIQSRLGKNTTYWFPWPFLARYTGPTEKGFRIWPLIQRRHRANGERRDTYLWPLGHHYATLDEDDGWSTQTMFLPFYVNLRDEKREVDYLFPYYGRVETETRRSRSYFWPIYTHTTFKPSGKELNSMLWSFIQWGETPEYKVWRAFPLFEVRRAKNEETNRVLWPFYTERLFRFSDYEFFQRLILPISIWKERRYSDSALSTDRVIVPFYRRKKMRDGSTSFYSMWFFWVVDSRGFERCWAPLLGWWTAASQRDGDGHTHVFGRLYRRETYQGRTHRSVEFLGFGFDWDDYGKGPGFFYFDDFF